MTEVSTDQLKQAVESQHGGTATYVQTVPVHERHGDQTVWNGAVAIFDLAGHPKAKRAYAWSSHVDENSTKRRFVTVLGVPPITGPVEAVRAAIVAEARAAK